MSEQQFDADGSGALDKVEFERFLSKAGAFISTQETRTLFDSYDLNKDGKLVFKEMLTALRVGAGGADRSD